LKSSDEKQIDYDERFIVLRVGIDANSTEGVLEKDRLVD